MKKMKERQGKSNFLKSLLSDNSMGDHSPLINKENSPERCANSSQVEANEKLDTKKKSGFNLLLQPDYILDSFNSPTNRSSQTEVNNHSQVKSKASLKHSYVSAPSSPTSSNSNNFPVSRKARNKLNFSLGKALSPKGIHDSMNSQSERGKSLDPPEKKINLKPKYRKEIEIKNSKKFAKGEIEKDLYKYLLKYKNEKEYQGLVLQTSDTKIKEIKSIEEKAKEKFDVFLKTKKSLLQDPNEDQAENLESPTTMKKLKVYILFF